MAELAHGTILRGARRVLEPARLPLPAGGTIGIVGVNGAGKSTLFYALAGMLHPTCGSATLGDRPAAPCAFSPQQPAFPPWLKVDRVARLFGFARAELESAFPGLLLDELRGRAAGTLSVGQRQALSVALALAIEAPLTLLDEPFAPLDFRRRIALVRLLRERRGEHAGGLTFVSSQAAADLLDTCDWIVVLRSGRYVFSGAASELTGDSADPAGARQRFEDAIMTLLTDAAPSTIHSAAHHFCAVRSTYG